jgi:DNA-binding IclR family transcriptional regulator
MKDAVTQNLNKALHLLETLSDQESQAIVDCLYSWREATLIDLLIRTGLDREFLFDRLELLLKGGLISYDHDNNVYQLCRKKLVNISKVTISMKAKKTVIVV